jgi:hypothetical protein
VPARPVVPRLWDGETVVCIASGPSLTPEDVEAVRGRARVIVVNTSYQIAPWADVLYAADAKWWKWHRGAPTFAGRKYSITKESARWPGVVVLARGASSGLSHDPSRLCLGANGGYQAINLAVLLGASRIVLLGYDMAIGLDGKEHWHADHPNPTRSPYQTFRAAYPTLVEPLTAAGVEVINCSRRTALNCFPRAVITDLFPSGTPRVRAHDASPAVINSPPTGPLSVVCWKWRSRPGYRSAFGPDAVNVLRRMVARHYPDPHRFICVTDDPQGLDPEVTVVPLWDEFAEVPNPNGALQPSCYRRLKAFSADAVQWFGERFVSVDLDTVIVNDLRPLWNRPEDFVIWGETNPRSFYNGSMWLMTAGARRQVYDDFDPQTSPREAHRHGRFGSDQGWISHRLGPGEAMWGRDDGVYSFRVHLNSGTTALPADARMVMFHGKEDPWCPLGQRLEWVREHYR